MRLYESLYRNYYAEVEQRGIKHVTLARFTQDKNEESLQQLKLSFRSQHLEYLEGYCGRRCKAEAMPKSTTPVSFHQFIQERSEEAMWRLERSSSTVWEPVEMESILKG